jgi:hypothetical protein
MITLREALIFLVPAFAGGVFAVVILQVLDRLKAKSRGKLIASRHRFVRIKVYMRCGEAR